MPAQWIMRVTDFQYDLPKYLIAQEPIPNRTDSRLLVLDGASGALQDRHFADLPEMLNPGDLLVFNDTRVLKARLFGRRPTGGKVEILIERVKGDRRALAHLNPARVQKPGTTVLEYRECTAIRDTVNALEELGFSVETFQPPKDRKAARTTCSWLSLPVR